MALFEHVGDAAKRRHRSIVKAQRTHATRSFNAFEWIYPQPSILRQDEKGMYRNVSMSILICTNAITHTQYTIDT